MEMSAELFDLYRSYERWFIVTVIGIEWYRICRVGAHSRVIFNLTGGLVAVVLFRDCKGHT
jgi:hypothetical protein